MTMQMKWTAKIDHVDFVGVESVERSDQLYHLFHGREVELECDEDDIEAVLREMFADETQLGVEEVEFTFSEKVPHCDKCGVDAFNGECLCDFDF